jgi:hypothetical protein
MSETIKYVWLDEDGEQVSALHKNFATALNFINGWHDRYMRLKQRYPGFEHSSMHYQAMTKSGKPPVQLVRVVIRTDHEELTEAERMIVEAMLDGQATDEEQSA